MVPDSERVVALIKTYLPDEFALVGSATVRAIAAGATRFDAPERSESLDISQALTAIAALAVFANNILQVIERVRSARPQATAAELQAEVRSTVATPERIEPDIADAVTRDLAQPPP